MLDEQMECPHDVEQGDDALRRGVVGCELFVEEVGDGVKVVRTEEDVLRGPRLRGVVQENRHGVGKGDAKAFDKAVEERAELEVVQTGRLCFVDDKDEGREGVGGEIGNPRPLRVHVDAKR